MAKILEPGEMSQAVNAAQAVQTEQEVPSGYITIELSTHGLVGAPARFHIRNFDTSDLMNLALSEDEDLPEKVARMLDNLILEKNVSVLDFHEKEVSELLVRLYQAFYSNTLKDIDFPWGDEDIDFLKKQYGGDTSAEFQTRYTDLKQGREKPKTDVNLATVETYDLDPNTFKTNLSITKKDGFKVGFSFPRYGDVVVLRNFILQEFRQRDKEFSSIKEILKFREDAKKRVREGEEIPFNRIPNIPEIEKEKYKAYETEKAIFTVVAIKALHLINFEGVDVSQIPLKDKLAFAKDPRLDYTISQMMDKHYKKLELGLKDKVSMKNPLKGVVELRDYSFRLVDILQAIKLHESDEYSVDFE